MPHFSFENFFQFLERRRFAHTMDQTGKMFACILGAVFLICSTSLITYFAVSNFQTCESKKSVSNNDEIKSGLRFTNEGIVDLVQNLRLSDKGLSLSKGLAGGKCFVLTNDQNPTQQQRALSVLNEELTFDQLEALGGPQATEFCRGLTITRVQHITQDFRTRRQAQPEHGSGSGTVTNECAQKVIVQCSNDTSVYKCVSGPKEAYREKITCKKANQFTLDLTTRCKEFDNTKSDRLQKCLEKIILNQQGAGGQAPVNPQGAAGGQGPQAPKNETKSN